MLDMVTLMITTWRQFLKASATIRQCLWASPDSACIANFGWLLNNTDIQHGQTIGHKIATDKKDQRVAADKPNLIFLSRLTRVSREPRFFFADKHIHSGN